MLNIFIIDLTYRIKFIMLKYINYKKLVIIFVALNFVLFAAFFFQLAELITYGIGLVAVRIEDKYPAFASDILYLIIRRIWGCPVAL